VDVKGAHFSTEIRPLVVPNEGGRHERDQVSLRLFDGRLPAKTRRSLDQILDYCEKNHSKDDDRWLAYALGTAHHETDRSFGPIREYGRGRGKKYYPYYGRGLVRLTWDATTRK